MATGASVSLPNENDMQASCSTTGSRENSGKAVGFRIQWTPELDDSLISMIWHTIQTVGSMEEVAPRPAGVGECI